MKEIWPFHDESSGAKIQPERYYGFSDSGGLAGSFDGYATIEEARVDIQEKHGYPNETIDFGVYPWQLGSMWITILNGKTYTDRLKVIEGHHDISFYGHWSEE